MSETVVGNVEFSEGQLEYLGRVSLFEWEDFYSMFCPCSGVLLLGMLSKLPEEWK